MLLSNNPRTHWKQDFGKKNIAGFLLLLFLLSGSLITNAQQKIQPGHTFKAGDKIRLVIANFSSAPRDTLFLLTIPPSVLPVMVNYSGVFSPSNSCIELPVTINSRTTVSFNPVTTVEYSVSASGKIELKAFDSSGGEVTIFAGGNHRDISHCKKLRAVILNSVIVN
jgi:hypothetical protein